MGKQQLNYIFINPNESEEKKKRYEKKLIEVLAIGACKKLKEEMEKSNIENPETEEDVNSVEDS